MSDVLKHSRVGRIEVLTFNRPDKLNAFNNAMFDAVGDALFAASQDPSVSCVVVTGEGRAFSSGLDLNDDAPAEDGRGFPYFIAQVESFPKPLLAAVNGLGVGVGLTMLTHCDLVIVSELARFKAPFVEIGLTGEAGSTVTLPWTVGRQNANHMLFAAPWVSAQESVKIGLALRAVKPEMLMAITMELAERVAAMSLESLMATKRLLVAGRIDAVRAARSREDREFIDLVAGEGHRRALDAFRRGSR